MNISEKTPNKYNLKKIILEQCTSILSFKEENFNFDLFNQFKKFVILKTIDQKWQDHLYMMDQLREGINLRAYGQKNPLVEYKHEGFAMFEIMMSETNRETLKRVFRTDLSNVANQSMHQSQAKNLKVEKNHNVLSGLTTPPPSNKNIPSNQQNPLIQGASPLASNKKKSPIVADKKIGRNDKVTIQKGSEKKIVKYKKHA